MCSPVYNLGFVRRQSILDAIAEWLGISQYAYPDKVLRFEGNVGMSQRGRDSTTTAATGQTTAHEDGRNADSLSRPPKSEEEQVMERGLGDCDTSLAELLGGWDLSYS
eukprot:COSAG02_NODE_1982_length_10196_cov_6.214816_15_plen_108_part_00